MAFRNQRKIFSLLYTTQQAQHNQNMFLHKNRKYSLENRRHFTCKGVESKTCPSRACTKKQPFWKSFFKSKEQKAEEQQQNLKPPIECCKIKFYSDDREDPDLSQFGGKAYRTCGKAYVVQKESLPENCKLESKEEKMVQKIEVHPDLKEVMEDPVSKHHNVSQRMLEINDRKLHPLYNKYRHTPRFLPAGHPPVVQTSYKTIGPIDAYDIPLNIKFNKKLLERKNLYAEYKRVEPPMQLIGRIVEMKKNAKPTLEKGSHVCRPSTFETMTEKHRKRQVFDSLNQSNVTC